MNKISNVSRIGLISAGAVLAILVVFSVNTNKAHAAITSQMQLGSRGAQVSELQQFLATNSFIYPEGAVTGYFGRLTQAAVLQFQVAYDISQVGRVGPQTMAKINNIVSSGFGLDISAPALSNVSVQTGRTGATISWNTNELARGQVFYDSAPIRSDESTQHAQQAYVSGTPITLNTGAQMSQTASIQNLNPDATYYYLVRGVDNSGNVVMTIQGNFHTNQ